MNGGSTALRSAVILASSFVPGNSIHSTAAITTQRRKDDDGWYIKWQSRAYSYTRTNLQESFPEVGTGCRTRSSSEFGVNIYNSCM